MSWLEFMEYEHILAVGEVVALSMLWANDSTCRFLEPYSVRMLEVR